MILQGFPTLMALSLNQLITQHCLHFGAYALPHPERLRRRNPNPSPSPASGFVAPALRSWGWWGQGQALGQGHHCPGDIGKPIHVSLDGGSSSGMAAGARWGQLGVPCPPSRAPHVPLPPASPQAPVEATTATQEGFLSLLIAASPYSPIPAGRALSYTRGGLGWILGIIFSLDVGFPLPSSFPRGCS